MSGAANTDGMWTSTTETRYCDPDEKARLAIKVMRLCNEDYSRFGDVAQTAKRYLEEYFGQ